MVGGGGLVVVVIGSGCLVVVVSGACVVGTTLGVVELEAGLVGLVGISGVVVVELVLNRSSFGVIVSRVHWVDGVSVNQPLVVSSDGLLVACLVVLGSSVVDDGPEVVEGSTVVDVVVVVVVLGFLVEVCFLNLAKKSDLNRSLCSAQFSVSGFSLQASIFLKLSIFPIRFSNRRLNIT